MNVLLSEFVPVLAAPNLSLGLRVVCGAVPNVFINFVDYFCNCFRRKIGKSGIRRDDFVADRRRGEVEKLQEMMSGNISPAANIPCEIGILRRPLNELVKPVLVAIKGELENRAK